MDTVNLTGLIEKGTERFFEEYHRRVVSDVEGLMEVIPSNGNSFKTMIIAFFAVRLAYRRQFEDDVSGFEAKGELESKLASFAERSQSLLLSLFVEETLEKIHQDYSFEEIYEKGVYYPDFFSYMEKQGSQIVPPGYFFRIEAEEEEQQRSVYIYADKACAFNEIIERAMNLLNDPMCFTCGLVPLDYLPTCDEFYVYMKISDNKKRIA